MLAILDVLAQKDSTTDGDFWRQQTFVEVPEVPRPKAYLELLSSAANCLQGKRIAVPKMFIGEHDPMAKPTVVSADVKLLWKQAKQDLENLGAAVIETDFPLVSNYEDDFVSGQANNVVGFKPDWNGKERGELVAYLWDDFLKTSGNPNFADGLAHVDGSQMFPRPDGYIPDRYMEHKNFINYPGLVEMCKHRNGKSIWDIDGIAEALPALEAQRKRDLEDWMDSHNLDLIVFPANGDVGRADLEYNDESARHALQNGVKYSNGNRAIRHMGVPTVSTTMGIMPSSQMPVNLTFAGKHAQDQELLKYAYAYEQSARRRLRPPVTPELDTDRLARSDAAYNEQYQRKVDIVKVISVERLEETALRLTGSFGTRFDGTVKLEVCADGRPLHDDYTSLSEDQWSVYIPVTPFQPAEPLYGGVGLVSDKFNIIVLARCGGAVAGHLVMVPQSLSPDSEGIQFNTNT